MTTQALRKQITALVNTIDDEAVLQSILTLLEKTKVDDEDEHIVGYDVQGNPISEEELVQSLLDESAGVVPYYGSCGHIQTYPSSFARISIQPGNKASLLRKM